MVKNFFISYIENDNLLHKAIEDINLLPDVEKAVYQSFQQKIRVTYSKDVDEQRLTKDIMDVLHNYDDNIKISEKMVAITDTVNKSNIFFYAAGLLVFVLTITPLIPEDYKWIGFLAGLLLSGKNLLKKTYYTVFKERVINESLLILLAVAGAYLIKDYIEAMLVLTFYVAADYLGWKASLLAKKDVSETLHKEETLVYKLNDKVVLATPIKEIREQDIIVIRPGEVIPLYSKVLEGKSNIDMSPISNENFEIEAIPGSILKSGAVNLEKPLKLLVLKTYNEGVVKELITATQEAMDQKKGFAKTSEKIGEIYVRAVGILAIILIVIGFLSDNPSQMIYKGLILLAVSCPWAMLISTPIAYNYALSLAKKIGVLIKDIGSVDAIGRLNALFFTKTGILTTGQYAIKEIIPYKNNKEEHILTYAAIGEINARHPIGKAIVKAMEKKLNPQLLQEYNEERGKGAIAVYGDRTVIVGTESFLTEHGIEAANDYYGLQVHVAVDNQYIGSIVLEEKLKPEGVGMVEKLKSMKIGKVAVLTAETKQSASAVLAPLKIGNIYGEMNIDEKVSRIKKEKKKLKGGTVAFIGDTISDSMVMAASDVSFAFLKGRLDKVTEVADVVLLKEDLNLIYESVALGKRTYQIIMQNIIISLLIKILIIAFILLNPVPTYALLLAIVIDLIVSLLTIINCFRITKSVSSIIESFKEQAAGIKKAFVKKTDDGEKEEEGDKGEEE